jgi:hypothetical protein
MSLVEQGHMRNFFMQYFSTLTKGKAFHHAFNESNPKMRSACALERCVRNVQEMNYTDMPFPEKVIAAVITLLQQHGFTNEVRRLEALY